MRPAALADPLCGSLCDLCASVVSVFPSNFTTETHREPQRLHREIVNATRAPIYFFSNLLVLRSPEKKELPANY